MWQVDLTCLGVPMGLQVVLLPLLFKASISCGVLQLICPGILLWLRGHYVHEQRARVHHVRPYRMVFYVFMLAFLAVLLGTAVRCQCSVLPAVAHVIATAVAQHFVARKV